MRRVAADHAAERDDAREAPRLREGHRRERQLERAGDGHHRDRAGVDAAGLELLERRVEQASGDLAVEPADDDPDRAAPAARLAFEDGVAGRDLELARGVLRARLDRLGGRFGRERPGRGRLLDDCRLVGQLGRIGRLGSGRGRCERLVGVGLGRLLGRLVDGRRGPALEDVLAGLLEVVALARPPRALVARPLKVAHPSVLSQVSSGP